MQDYHASVRNLNSIAKKKGYFGVSVVFQYFGDSSDRKMRPNFALKSIKTNQAKHEERVRRQNIVDKVVQPQIQWRQ